MEASIYQKWHLRALFILQIVCFLAVALDSLRNSIVFPEGTTPADALIYFFLLVILEEAIRIKARLGAE